MANYKKSSYKWVITLFMVRVSTLLAQAYILLLLWNNAVTELLPVQEVSYLHMVGSIAFVVLLKLMLGDYYKQPSERQSISIDGGL